jgi:hypothetical protein
MDLLLTAKAKAQYSIILKKAKSNSKKENDKKRDKPKTINLNKNINKLDKLLENIVIPDFNYSEDELDNSFLKLSKKFI